MIQVRSGRSTLHMHFWSVHSGIQAERRYPDRIAACNRAVAPMIHPNHMLAHGSACFKTPVKIDGKYLWYA